MGRAADHSPLADLALALEEIDMLSVVGLSRNHNAPIEPELLALRAAVSRASVCLRKIEFWLVPATRMSLMALSPGDNGDDGNDGGDSGERVVPDSPRRIIVAFRRSVPAEPGDRLRRPDGPCPVSE